MIPIRDTNPSKNYPVATHAIIAVNVVCFLIQLSQGQRFDTFAYVYGLVPARYTSPEISSYFSFGQQAFSLLSFMFLHGGFLHLIGNMWFLHIFGDNVEDRLGSLRFVAFYILCGLLSGICHFALNTQSNTPTIGASGAIAGVMGAYFILHPTAKILTLVPIVIIPFFFEIPAFFFLGIWLLLQLVNAAGTHGQVIGVAWWAHIGGFAAGVILLKLFKAFPSTGFSGALKQATEKKKTPGLQILRPTGSMSESDLYGTIYVTQFEALNGTRKIVNIPWGFQKRLYRVIVPPGVHDGSTLRLANLGKIKPEGGRGDLFLTVRLEQM